MKRLYAILAILLLSGGLALAQSAGRTSGFSNQDVSAQARTSYGMAPSFNPSNPQDLTNRSNPQDMTLPGASNPQDLIR
jgi:ABC-type oligopeptide transport system substrate-binding subunit